MKKFLALIIFFYCAIIWLLCIFGVCKAIYELFVGGISNVYATDWLLVEIPYIFIAVWLFQHTVDKNSWLYNALND